MSAEVPQTGCSFRRLASRSGLVSVLAMLSAVATIWVVTAMREPPVVETVEVLVAAKDLPVGTMISRDDLKDEKVVKIKKLPKDGLPPAFVTNKDDLVDKRLTRPIRAEETFNPQDLTKQSITLPEGFDMVALPMGIGQVIGPGSRVDVFATARKGNRPYVFPLLVNVLAIAVDSQLMIDPKGVLTEPHLMSFAVTEKQAALIALAKSREWRLEVVLHNPDRRYHNERDVDIDYILKFLEEKDAKPIPPAGEDPEER